MEFGIFNLMGSRDPAKPTAEVFAEVAEPETGGMLVPMLVRLRLAGQLVGGEMMVHIGVRGAAQRVLDPELDPGIGERVLDAGAWHHAGREGMALDDNWILGQHEAPGKRRESCR